MRSLIRLITLRIKQLIALTYLCTIGLIFSIILSKKWSKQFNKWAEDILSGQTQDLNSGEQTNDLVNADGTIKGLKSQVEDLQTKLAKKDAEIQELEAEKNTLKKRIKELEEAHRATLNTQIAELENAQVNLKAAEVKHKEEAEKFTTEKSILEKKIKELEENHNKAQEEVGRLTKKSEGANQALTAFSNLCTKQVEQLGNLQTENKELKSTIEDLKASYKELGQVIKEKGEDFLTKLKVKFDEVLRLSKKLMEHTVAFANTIELHETESEEKGMEISRLTTLNAQLEQDKKAAEDKEIVQQQTISEQNNRIKELEAQLRKSKEESNKQSMMVQSLTADNKNINETVKKENAQLKEREKELEAQVELLQGEKGSLKQQNKQELEKAQRKNEELTEELQAKQKHIENQITASESLQTQLNNLTLANNRLDEKFRSLEQQLVEKNRELIDEKEEVERLEHENKDLEKNLIQLRDAHTQWEDSEHKLRSQLEKSQEDHVRKEQELEQAKSGFEIQKSQLEETQSALQNKVQEYEAKIQTLQNDYAKREQELTQTHQSLDTKDQELLQTQSALENAKTKHQEALQAKDKELLIASEEVRALKEDYAKKEEGLIQTHQSLDAKDKELAQAKSSLEAKGQELAQAQSALETQESQLGKAHEIALKAAETTYKAQLKEQSESISQFKKELGDLNSKLETVTKEKQGLEAEVSKLQKKVADLEQKEVNVENLRNGHQKTNKALIDKNEELQRLNISLTTEKGNLLVELNRKKDEIKKQQEATTKIQEELAKQKILVDQLQGKNKQIEALTKKEAARGEGQVKIGQDTVASLQTEEKRLRKSIQELKEEPQKEEEPTKVQDPDTMSINSQGSTAGSDTPYISKNFLVYHIFHGPCKSQDATFNFFKSSKNAIRGTNFYRFLSSSNNVLKKTFPALEEQFRKQHFCHKVFERAIIGLYNSDDESINNNGRFKIDNLSKLLKDNFTHILKGILAPKVREIVTKHQDELEGCIINEKMLKEKELLDSITECMKVLGYNVKGANTIKGHVLKNFNKSGNNEPLIEIVINVLSECKASSIYNKVEEEKKLASKIINEFLSQNEEICPKVSKDECQFNSTLISEIYGNGTPNTSMSRTNSTQKLAAQSNDI